MMVETNTSNNEATSSTIQRLPMLRFDRVNHSFGTRKVLDELSLQVEHGECFGLLGPNGSGKSTALALIAGLLEPAGGTITFDGAALPAAHRALYRQAGFVFQSPALDPKLSVRSNLMLAARLRGLTGAAAEQRIDEQLALVGLGDRARDSVAVLSGGMRRRLDLARALLHRPRLLLLDEPTAGLDEVSFRQTWDRIERLRRQLGLTVVVATHRPDEAERCDRLAIMAGGRVALVDTPEALKRRTQRDAIVIQPADTSQLDNLRAEVATRFELPCAIELGRLVIECARGHELIPRLVEAYPEGHWATVSLRHPTLADVFFKITGQTLGADDEGSPAGSGKE